MPPLLHSFYWRRQLRAGYKSEEQAFSVEQIASVIRWVSFALIVVPFMSLWRGFFQGYDKMQPTAVSQLVEQIVRIVVLLGGSFLVVVVLMENHKQRFPLQYLQHLLEQSVV